MIVKILKENEDKDIVADCCWTLSYLSDGGGEKIQYLVESGIVPRLVQLLE